MFAIIISSASLIVLASTAPLQMIPSLSLPNTSFDEIITTPIKPANSTTGLSTLLSCFAQSNPPSIFPTNKNDCETALDNWVRGNDLAEPRIFSREPSYHLQDVQLPLLREFGTCVMYLNTVSPGVEDTLTLAEIYAEVLGPDGLAKQCLAPKRQPALGGTMKMGPRKVVFAVITGMVRPAGAKN